MIQTIGGDICGLIILILAVGHMSTPLDRYVCKENAITDNFVRLHFNSSILSEIEGICICRFRFIGTSFFKVKTDAFILQNNYCRQGDIIFTLIDKQRFPFTCNNNRLDTTSSQDLSRMEHNPGDTVWLIVSISSGSTVLSGSLAFLTTLIGGSAGQSFTMNCYAPNTNMPNQSTTQVTSTMDLASTSTISQTSTTSTMDSSTLKTSTTSSTSATTTTKIAKSPSTIINSEISTSKQSTSSLNRSISDDTSTVGPESKIGNHVPVTAIAGGAAGGVAVLVIIAVVVTIISYRNKKRKSSNGTDNDLKFHDQYQMSVVYGDNETSTQDLKDYNNPHNDDQCEYPNSVNEDSECVSVENILYESVNSLQIS